MQRPDLTFRVFVSSTFGDLVAERNALQEVVFPRLRRDCRRRGARFQAIDLRWGVPEEAGLDQQTMTICLEEIRRCRRASPRPSFIFLLGQRYGWCPLPARIHAEELEALVECLPEPERRRLFDWYQRDDNAVPPEYRLQARTGAFEERTAWAAEEAALRDSLSAAVERAGWAVTDARRLKYETSATHQEILLGALERRDPGDHAFGFVRTIAGLPGDARANGYLDLDAAGRPDLRARGRLAGLQAELEARLPGNIHHYAAIWTGAGPSTDHLGPLCEDVYQRLSAVIEQELERHAGADPVDQEALAHETFGRERARHFVGRADRLSEIRDYLRGDDRQPLVLCGVSGVGKSALMARVASGCPQIAGARPVVVVRYLGATPASSDLRSLLEGLCREITRRYGGDPSTVPTERLELEQDFAERLMLATPNKPLVLLLDALDQLGPADGAHRLDWLPRELPARVKLVVSVLDEPGPASAAPARGSGIAGMPASVYEAARQRVPPRNLVRIAPLRVESGAGLLDAWLSEAGRTLQPSQRQALLDRFAGNGLPLYLKLAFEEARRWPSWETARPAAMAGDVPGLLDALLTRLEQPRHHGAMLVSRALGYLATGRHGLTEDELLDVLSADLEVMDDFVRRSRTEGKKAKEERLKDLPVVIWARLYADLEPYLTHRRVDGAAVLDAYHRQVGVAVRKRYLADAGTGLRAHRHLAAYFHAQDALLDSGSPAPEPVRRPFATVRSVNVRKVMELPHHRIAAAKLGGGRDPASPLWDELADLLTDWRFLEAKNEAGSPGTTYALADDVRQALAVMPRGHRAYDGLAALADALFGSIRGLAEQPRLLTQTLTNRLRSRPVSPAARELIRAGERLLGELGCWVSADDGIRETHQWQGILAVSPRLGLVHCRTEQGRILDCGLDSQEVIRAHVIPKAPWSAIAVCPFDGRVAVVTREGAIWTSEGAEPVALRPRSNLFAGFGRGFIGIDTQARLLYWDRSLPRPILLAHDLPGVGCSIAVIPSGAAAVALAGDRPGSQRLFLLRGQVGAPPSCAAWTGEGRLVTAACLDDLGARLVLATADRQLSLVDLATGKAAQRIGLSQLAGRPLGEVIHCACASAAGGARVLFADVDGAIALWETESGRLRYVARYRDIQSPSDLIALSWLDDGERFVVATHDSLRVIGVADTAQEGLVPTVSAVSDCTIAADGWLVLIQEQAQRLTWIREGVACETYYHPRFRPRVVARHGAQGEILVGARGTLAKLRPGHPLDGDDALDLFDRPIVAVLPAESGTAATVCETGEIKLVRLSEEWVQPSKPPLRDWVQQGACRLGGGPEIIGWGRFIADAATSRVVLADQGGALVEVFSARDPIVAVATSSDGPLIHIALPREVVSFARQGCEWKPIMRRAESVSAMAALFVDRLVVLPSDRAWLEIWSATESLQTLARCYLPVSATCLATSGQQILVGTLDGKHVLLTLHQERGATS